MPAHQASPPVGTPQWPYHSFLPLGALPGAVPCARLHTTAVLWEWGLEDLSHPAELVASELVTNAVRASISAWAARRVPGVPTGLPTVGFRLAGAPGHLLIEVSDHDPGPPVPAGVDPERDGGRGLLLVGAVSARWGYYYPATELGTVDWERAMAAGRTVAMAAAPTVLAPADQGAGKVVWALISVKGTS